MNELMYNYLPNTNIYLYQRKDMFRFNTDTHLLGAFMKCGKDDRVLDIGTNNGALLLYASQFAYKELVGIDILKEACDLANYNLEHNKISNYRIVNCALQEYHDDPFDVIICNPPYFETDGENMVNENAFIKTARHEVNLSLELLFAKVSELLVDKGHFYLVHRSARLVDIILLADKYKLGIVRIKHVFDESSNRAGAILVEARKNIAHNTIIERPHEIKR